MKFVVEEENYNEGLRLFLKLYYKEELKQGSLKNCLVVFIFSFLVLTAFCIIMPGMIELFLKIIYLLIIIGLGIVVGIAISLLINKKRKFDVKKLECIFANKIIVKVYKFDGVIQENEYDYKNILKVIETKEYFYLFLNEAVAFPLYKDIYLKRDEYVDFIKSKNIVVKEYVE